MARPPQLARGQRRRAVQFAILGNLVPIAIATAIDFDAHHAVFFVGAAAACIAPIVVTLGSRRHLVPFYTAAYGGILALTLMQAYSGGAASGYSILVMMAMVWFGVQASDRELVAGIGMLAACSYLPMLVVGPAAYPVEWGHASLLVLIGAAVSGSLRTVTRETQALTERLRQEAVIDDLTGLLNRRGWRIGAERELARAGRASAPVALVLLDLDKLKEVNDTMGHDVGDRVLAETADRLRAGLRASDIVARLGGDEFVALLTDSTLDGALAGIERLRAITPELGSFSAGVAAWNRKEDLEQLLRRADMALYAAKTKDGGKVELAPEVVLDTAPAAS